MMITTLVCLNQNSTLIPALQFPFSKIYLISEIVGVKVSSSHRCSVLKLPKKVLLQLQRRSTWELEV